MMVVDALRELDELLTREERALIEIDLEQVVTLAGRKAELVQTVEEEIAASGDILPVAAKDLARSVHTKAHRNRFLLQHLRGCLKVVNPVGDSGQTYGRDGRTNQSRMGSGIRVRL